MVGILSTDTSTSFDFLNPGLMLSKLEAYGFLENFLKLMQSYFYQRQGRVKLGTTVSW